MTCPNKEWILKYGVKCSKKNNKIICYNLKKLNNICSSCMYYHIIKCHKTFKITRSALQIILFHFPTDVTETTCVFCPTPEATVRDAISARPLCRNVGRVSILLIDI